MTNEEALVAVIRELNTVGIPYMLVGSISANYYGVPRLTQDADVVVGLVDDLFGELARRLAPSIRFDPQLEFETVTMTKRRRANLGDAHYSFEFFEVSRDPHDQERFGRRVKLSILGVPAYLPTVEDVVITKLRWARPKDRQDIRGVLAIQGDAAFDWDYIHRWTETHGTRALLDEIRASIPEI